MKQINSLFSSFHSNSDYPMVAKLQKSSILQNNLNIQMSDIIYLIECFEGYGPEQNGTYLSGIEYIQQFFTYLSQNKILPLACLKICVSLHLVLYEFQVGEILAEQILKSPQSLNQLSNDQEYKIPISEYKMYLLKLAQSLKIFYAAKVGQYPPMEQEDVDIRQFNEKKKQKTQSIKQIKKNKDFGKGRMNLHQYQQEQLQKQFQSNAGYININQKQLILFKLHNLMQSGIQLIKDLVQLIPNQNKNGVDSLLVEISCVLWNDIMVGYKFCGQETIKLTDDLRGLTYQQVVTIQQLYYSILEKTKEIKFIYDNRRIFDVQNILRKPYWYDLDKSVKSAIDESLIDLKFQKAIEYLIQLNYILIRSQRVMTTTEKLVSQKDKQSFKHPFTSRNQFRNTQQQQQNIMTQPQQDSPTPELSPQETRRQQYIKQALGAIFEDDCLQKKEKQKLQSKDNSTQPSNNRK